MVKYNKQWYDKQMENPEFRSKRVNNTRQYREKIKRETYERAIAFIWKLGNPYYQEAVGGNPFDMEAIIDEVMAKYKIIERK